MANGCRPFQAETAVGGDQGLAGDIGAHAAIAQDEVWQNREYRLTRGALDAPDGETTQPDTGIMGVARQAPALITGRFVLQLEAEGQKEGEDTLEKRLAIAEEVAVGGFVSKIDGDRAVVVLYR